MAIPLKYATASQEVPLGYFLDSGDGDSEETSLTIANTDIKLWKSGATTLANKNSGGATHISNGVYYCTLDATDTNTYGPMVIFVHVSGALAVRLECVVMEADAYDALYAAAGTGHVEADAVQISGDATAADNAELAFDGTGYGFTGCTVPTVTTLTGHTAQTGDSYARLGAPAGASVSADIATVDGNVDSILADTGTDGVVLADGAITAAKIATDAITSDEIAASAVTEIQSGLATAAELAKVPKSDGTATWNATALASINAECDTALSDYDAVVPADLPTNFADLSITVTTGRVDVASIEGSDATDQIRDAVVDDATRIDASALNTLSGHDPGSQIAAQSDVTGLNDPTAAAIADAVWDEAATGHTDAGKAGEQLWTDVDAILADTGTDGVLLAPGAVTAAAVATDAIDADALAADAATEIADAVLTRDWTSVTGEAARSVLNALRFLRNKWSISGSTLTVTEEDDSTSAWTATLTTDSGADPITASDPT